MNRINTSYIWNFIAFFLLFDTHIVAQNLNFNNTQNSKAISVSGGLNLNNLYNSYLPSSPNHYSYFLNGYVNFKILGVLDVPLNINYSNRKFSYSQPFSFNQFSITPRYKWLTGYLGTTSMNFSSYTLNGHQFTGVGVDLNPSKFQISAMMGRFIKKNSDSTYNRNGYALRAMYNTGKVRTGFSLLNIGDDPTSVSNEVLKKNTIRPQKNVVLSIEAGVSLPKMFQFDFEFSNSFISDNSGLTNSGTHIGLAGMFFNGDGNISNFKAFKGRFSKGFSKTSTIVGFGYERIDPGYKTFGGYYFTDDLENITMNLSQRLLKNKLSFLLNIGSQRDLLETKANGQNRLVVSSNINYIPNNRFNTNISLSTFKGYTYIRNVLKEAQRDSPITPIDTLNFTQINLNLSVNINYSFIKTEEKTHGLSIYSVAMNAANKQGDIIRKGQVSEIYNNQLIYSILWTKKKFNLSLGYNYNINKIASNDITIAGPTVNLQKNILKDKVSMGLSVNRLQSESISSTNESNSSSVLNINFNSVFSISGKSRVVGNLLILNRSNTSLPNTDNNTGVPSNILTATLGYNYRF